MGFLRAQNQKRETLFMRAIGIGIRLQNFNANDLRSRLGITFVAAEKLVSRLVAAGAFERTGKGECRISPNINQVAPKVAAGEYDWQ